MTLPIADLAALQLYPRSVYQYPAIGRIARPLKMSVVGDSIPARNIGTGTATKQFYPRAPETLLRMQLGNDFDLQPENIFAVGSTGVVDCIENQMPLAIASDPDIILINTLSNDIVAGNHDVQYMMPKWIQLNQMALDRGIVTMPCTVLPRDAATTNQNQTMLAINQEIIRWSLPQPRVILSDRHAIFVDPDSLLGRARAGYMLGAPDSSHPTILGAWRTAQYEAALLRNYFALRSDFPGQGLVASVCDYCVVSGSRPNYYGNLFKNGMLTGTGGTVSAGISGFAPDDWTVAKVSGSGLTGTIAVFQEVDPEGGQWIGLQFTNVSGGPYGQQVKISQSLNQATGFYNTGDVVSAMGRVLFNGTAFLACGLQIQDVDGVTSTNLSDAMAISPGAQGAFPSGENIGGLLQTGKVTITPPGVSGTRTLNISMNAFFDATAPHSGFAKWRVPTSRVLGGKYPA